MLRNIRNRFSTKCRKCGVTLPKGSQVFWGKGLGTFCLSCGRKENGRQTESSEPKTDATRTKTPAGKSTDEHEYFTVDWPEFKRTLRRVAIDGETAGLKINSNEEYVKQHLTRSGGWHGFTPDQIKEWLTTGFKSEALKGLGDNVPVLREKRRFIFTEDGDEFHYDLAMSGEDKFFSEMPMVESIPGVSIEAGIMFASSVDSSVVNAYNVWLCKMAHSLESTGVDCQITLDFPSRGMVSGSRTDKKIWHNIVRVKKENELSDFMSWSAMMSPAALRGFGFCLGAIHADSKGQRVSGNFGYGMIDIRTEWKVEYDSERRVIVVENPYYRDETTFFPEERMTAQFRAVLGQLNQ